MTITCVVMFFVSSSELERFQREKSWKKVYESRNNLSWKTRSKIFEELYPSNKSNWDFLSIYGIELTVHKQYQKAIPILQEATGYMKTSDIYTHLGISYEEITDYENSKRPMKWQFIWCRTSSFQNIVWYISTKNGITQRSIRIGREHCYHTS